MTARGPERVRMSQGLASWLRDQGALSSVARGYMLFGMASAGVNIDSYMRDIQRTIAEDIPAQLRADLTALLGRPTGVLQVSYVPDTPARSLAPTSYDDSDPFDLGFDFELQDDPDGSS